MAASGGYGGRVYVTGSSIDVPVGKWKLSKKRVAANKTNSKSGGIKQRQATIKDQMVTLDIIWDDTINPEASGFTEGTEVAMVLNLGLTGHAYTSSAVLIESIEYENDEDEEIIKATLTGYANSAFTYT